MRGTIPRHPAAKSHKVTRKFSPGQLFLRFHKRQKVKGARIKVSAGPSFHNHPGYRQPAIRMVCPHGLGLLAYATGSTVCCKRTSQECRQSLFGWLTVCFAQVPNDRPAQVFGTFRRPMEQWISCSRYRPRRAPLPERRFRQVRSGMHH